MARTRFAPLPPRGHRTIEEDLGRCPTFGGNCLGVARDAVSTVWRSMDRETGAENSACAVRRHRPIQEQNWFSAIPVRGEVLVHLGRIAPANHDIDPRVIGQLDAGFEQSDLIRAVLGTATGDRQHRRWLGSSPRIMLPRRCAFIPLRCQFAFHRSRRVLRGICSKNADRMTCDQTFLIGRDDPYGYARCRGADTAHLPSRSARGPSTAPVQRHPSMTSVRVAASFSPIPPENTIASIPSESGNQRSRLSNDPIDKEVDRFPRVRIRRCPQRAHIRR